jgi:hypothetical protein
MCRITAGTVNPLKIFIEKLNEFGSVSVKISEKG